MNDCDMETKEYNGDVANRNRKMLVGYNECGLIVLLLLLLLSRERVLFYIYMVTENLLLFLSAVGCSSTTHPQERSKSRKTTRKKEILQ